MKNYCQIVQNGNTADIYIFGDLCQWPWKELGEVSAKSVVDEIKRLEADTINVYIDSFGGDVKEGWGLYNALKNQKATVHTYAAGFVASAALYPFLAGQKRTASPVSAFYLHQMMSGASGYAEDLRAAAEELDKLTEIGVNAFVQETGQSKEKILELMKQETWLSPEEALELGIVTQIDAQPKSDGLSQSARAAAVQKLRAEARQQPENKLLQMHLR